VVVVVVVGGKGVWGGAPGAAPQSDHFDDGRASCAAGVQDEVRGRLGFFLELARALTLLRARAAVLVSGVVRHPVSFLDRLRVVGSHGQSGGWVVHQAAISAVQAATARLRWSLVIGWVWWGASSSTGGRLPASLP